MEKKASYLILRSEKSNHSTGAKVNYKSGINLRQMPDLSGKIIKAIPFGEEVELLSKQKYNGNWYNVRTKSGISGFCFEEGLKFSQESKPCLSEDSDLSLEYIDRENFSNEVLIRCHANGKLLRGLLYRRIDELEMFFFANYKKDGRLNKYGFNFPEKVRSELSENLKNKKNWVAALTQFLRLYSVNLN